MVRITILYYSNFRGQTEKLALAIQRGAQRVPGTDVQLLRVEDAESHWQRLHDSDAIVFGSPTYIGSVAARFKQFIELLSGDVWLKRMWVNKVAAGFTVSAGRSGDKLNCLQQMVIFAAQMGMIWVPVRLLGGNYSSQGSEDDLNRMAGYIGVMAQANIDEPAEIAPPPSDIRTAEIHGEHVAEVTRALVAGRRALAAEAAPAT
ncbi:MAG: flavodoxin family protein [Steroidobacteraceae bacterium]|jgi:multimeric flavodoxin WrbA|nr:flavodoxin family protein [Steroidobacteraceae bacterium]